MIDIRQAGPDDAAGIGAVHVAAWRSAYAGILPDAYLANLSVARQSAYYQTGLMAGHVAMVAEVTGRIVGFVTMGRRRAGLADGEIETLYVLDDFRDQGAGRALMQGAAAILAARGCRSLFLWVLSENPSRWFYQRLGGRQLAHGETTVAGVRIPKIAYVWDPIDILLSTPSPAGETGPG